MEKPNTPKNHLLQIAQKLGLNIGKAQSGEISFTSIKCVVNLNNQRAIASLDIESILVLDGT
jgi:hypothetical protein